MSNYKLSIIVWAIGKCQDLLIWLQSQRFRLVEEQLDKIEKGVDTDSK
jgi:hypothetical protein